MTTPSLGVVFRPQVPPERLRSAVQTAEAAALDELWLWEDCFLEGGVSTAAAALAWSERVRVGIGLLPVPLRNPALAAMELATLCRLFGDRFRFGLGHGVQSWMEQVGARPRSPLTLLRENVEAVRRLLDGETVSSAGEYVSLTDVALDWPPVTPPPLLLGASKPKTLELSGAVADGTILTAGTTPDQLKWARECIDRGRAAASRDDPHQVVAYVLAAPGDRDPQGAGAETHGEAIDDVVVYGDAESVAAGVHRWADAGADTVVLQPFADETDIEGLIRFAGEEVAPLLG